MLAVLSDALPRIRTTAAAIGVSMILALAVAPGAGAEYQTVTNGLQQWVWVRPGPGVPMTAAVVRRDGWLVVATSERFDGRTSVGGGLLLVPPWGGSVIPFGDPPDYRTGAYGFTSLVVRGDRLFGLTSMPDQHSEIGQRARLFELDARSGKVIAEHGIWWFPDLAVDPQTGDLVLWAFNCTGRCGDDDTNGQTVGAVTHPLVRYDPDTRRTRDVLLPDAMTADIGGSGTCAARRAQLRNCDDVFRVAFSADGNTLFLGTTRAGSNAIDVRDRRGALRFTIPVSRPIDAMHFGAPSSCLANMLVVSSYDGTTWAIPNADDDSGAGGGMRTIASGGPLGASAIAVTPAGDMLTLRRSEGVLLACPGWRLPEPAVRPVATQVPSTVSSAAPAPPSASQPAGPVAASGQPPPPVQPPSLPAVAGPASHATQALTSVNIGLADAEEEQPVYSLSASRRAAATPAWATLGVGAAAVLGFAAIAFLAIPMPKRERQLRLARVRVGNSER